MNQASTPPVAASAKPTFGRVFALSRGVFALLGFGVALAVAVPQTRDGLFNQFQAVTWKPVVHIAAVTADDALETGGRSAAPHTLVTTRQEMRAVGNAADDAAHTLPAVARDDGRTQARAALTQFIANRYRVADEVVANIVNTAFRAAEAQSVDPLVVLAVVATESRYNPIAESVVGAKGLMQVIAKFHPEKLASHGGEDALFQPEVNILVGTQILREYLRRYGDLETALQVYAGAIDDEETRYARKVLTERALLKQALERSRRQA